MRRLNWIYAIFVGVMMAGSPSALAVTALKQVQISNGSQIDLLFDGKIQKGQIKTEFFNDIIQLSIQDVSVYPAKISSVNSGTLTKIFAYQYAPKLVRCRLTVKGKAEAYKDRFGVKTSGKVITVRLDGEVAVTQASASSESQTASEEKEERALLQKVMAPDAPAAAALKVEKAEASAQQQQAATKDSITVSASGLGLKGSSAASSSSLAGGKPLPSPLKAFGKLAVVLGIFGLIALGVKRFARNRAESRLIGGVAEGTLSSSGDEKNWFNAVGRFAKKNFGRGNKLIEVLSTHYLGPKKSIAVVRVAGRVLVLGVSSESINLITQLSGEETDPMGSMDGLDLGFLGGESKVEGKAESKVEAPKMGTGAMAAGGPVFSDLLQSEAAKPSLAQRAGMNAYGAAPAPSAPRADSLSGVRAQIRNRLEGLKQL